MSYLPFIMGGMIVLLVELMAYMVWYSYDLTRVSIYPINPGTKAIDRVRVRPRDKQIRYKTSEGREVAMPTHGDFVHSDRRGRAWIVEEDTGRPVAMPKVECPPELTGLAALQWDTIDGEFWLKLQQSTLGEQLMASSKTNLEALARYALFGLIATLAVLGLLIFSLYQGGGPA